MGAPRRATAVTSGTCPVTKGPVRAPVVHQESTSPPAERSQHAQDNGSHRRRPDRHPTCLPCTVFAQHPAMALDRRPRGKCGRSAPVSGPHPMRHADRWCGTRGHHQLRGGTGSFPCRDGLGRVDDSHRKNPRPRQSRSSGHHHLLPQGRCGGWRSPARGRHPAAAHRSPALRNSTELVAVRSHAQYGDRRQGGTARRDR
ncbi:Uncharacterised protein [Mycobacteroides abscessus subsp. massiliense]|nr:Uncharacterised protein [Mycobacteroides abscessus subsp. massiliense]